MLKASLNRKHELRYVGYAHDKKMNDMKGYMYILECCDGSYYTGSSKNLERRLAQHQAGEGAKHTKKRLPVKLVYFEEYNRIDEAFYREKQVQGWSRKKKEALITGKPELLPSLAMAYRDLRALEEGISGTSMPFVPEAPLPETPLPEAPLPEAPEGSGISLEGGISRTSMPFMPEAPLPEAPEGSGITSEGGISRTSMPLKVDKLITEKGISGTSMPFMPEAPLPEAPEGSGITSEEGISGTSMPFMPEAPLLPEAPEFKLPEAPEGSDIYNAQSIIKPET